MGILKADDYALVRAMRENELLEAVNFKKFNIAIETGAVICADCHQQNDIWDHLESECITAVGRNRLIHPFQLNGTPFLIAESNLVKDDHEDKVILKHIAKAIEIGKIRGQYMLLGHVVCGIAEGYGLSVYDCIELMHRGRLRVISEFDLNVSCLLQIDYTGYPGEQRKRTYHVNMSAWPTYSADFAKYDYTKSPLGLAKTQSA